MPVKSLPSNPSLEHLKYQARDLLESLRQGNAEAIARAREFHPEFARLSDAEFRNSKFSLADVQLIIAREYGFASWPKLKLHVEASAQATAAGSGALCGLKLPAGPVMLRQKWLAGAHFVKETGLKQSVEIHAPGKAEPVKRNLSLTSQHAYTVGKAQPGGGHEVELQHLCFRMEFDSSGYLFRYDSSQSSAADESDIAKVFQTILRAKVRYCLDASNQLERIEGLEELLSRLNRVEGAKLKPGMTWDNQALDKVLARMVSGTRQPLENAALGLRNMFTEDYFRNKLDPAFFPAGPVQPGDTWTFSRDSQKVKRNFLNVNIARQGTVSFQSWELHAERLCARLDFHGTQKTSREAVSETARTHLPISEGAFTGVLWLDPELGRTIEINVNHDFKASVNPVLALTGEYHQVITEKLVSVEGGGGAS